METVQSLAEVVGMGFLLGATTGGADQGVCLLLGAELLTPPPTKTRQIAMMARVGTSLLTGLRMAMVQSLARVVGTGFPLGAATAGAG